MVGIGKVTEEEVRYFAHTMCRSCNFCGNNLTMPFFCLTVYKGDKKRFLKIIKHLNAELVRDKDKSFKKYSTFLGFCGLFCNSGTCPAHGKKCDLIITRIHCYGMFVAQWAPGTLTDEIRKEIRDKFGKEDLSKLGSNFTALSDPFYGLKKGKKRSIKKSISKAHKTFSTAAKSRDFKIVNKSSNIKVRKKVSTSTAIFYNDDDKEWEEELKVILGGL